MCKCAASSLEVPAFHALKLSIQGHRQSQFFLEYLQTYRIPESFLQYIKLSGVSENCLSFWFFFKIPWHFQYLWNFSSSSRNFPVSGNFQCCCNKIRLYKNCPDSLDTFQRVSRVSRNVKNVQGIKKLAIVSENFCTSRKFPDYQETPWKLSRIFGN